MALIGKTIIYRTIYSNVILDGGRTSGLAAAAQHCPGGAGWGAPKV